MTTWIPPSSDSSSSSSSSSRRSSPAEAAFKAKCLATIQPEDIGKYRTYEEELLKNPGNLKLWIRYIQHKQPETQQQPPQQQLLIGLLVVFERALKEFPASFKLWKDYLDLRAYLLLRDAAGEEGDDVKYSANKNKKKTNTPQPSCLLKGQSAGFLSNPSGVNANSISPYSAACQNLLLTFADSPQHLALLVSSVTHAFERCLALCNKFPVIWLMYLRFTLATQQLVLFAKNGQGVEEDDEEESSSASSSILTTCIRRLFDRALRSLPITQHHLIWPAFLAFANSVGGPTAIRIWRRFLKLEREKAVESYMDALLHIVEPPRYAEAALCLSAIVDIPGFQSTRGKSRFQMWVELCDLVVEHAEEMLDSASTMALLSSTSSAAIVASGVGGGSGFTNTAVSSDGGEINTTSSSSTSLDLTAILNLPSSTDSLSFLDIDRILRTGITKFSGGGGGGGSSNNNDSSSSSSTIASTTTTVAGKLWTALGKWYILLSQFEKARDIYEEAMASVTSVRDFSLVFDAYAEFEESLLTAKMEALARKQQQLQQGNDEEEDDDEEGGDEVDVDIRLARFEKLMDRRPFLVNNVHLRQNPHNVSEWSRRARLYLARGEHDKVVEAFDEAVATVNPKKAYGDLHMLWVQFAQYYETGGRALVEEDEEEEKDQDGDDAMEQDGDENNTRTASTKLNSNSFPLPNLEAARKVFERAVKTPFQKVDHLAEVWCQWAEMELRNEEFDAALIVMGRATAPPRGLKPTLHHTVKYMDESLSPQQRLFKSLKLWTFYVDLEESIGSIESTRAAYDRILELKIANAQVLCNYAAFLEDNKWFEESYKAYERGIELFGYPMAFDFWTLYLTKFIARYGGSKLERTRDLFEDAVDKIPPNFAKSIYLMYAKLEEDYGLARHAMRIYDRATRAVDVADRYEMYAIYIAKAAAFFGLPATREIYERAIESLPDKQARSMCVKFAELEIKLGEVDRARAVYGYASQFSDPRMDAEFWKIWHEFEVKFGNEDTFKEMLRIKRSVQAKFNTDVNFISAQLVASKQRNAGDNAAPDSIEALEAANGSGTKVGGFVRAKKTEPKVRHPDAKDGDDQDGETEAAAANPDEIEISDDSDDDDNNKNGDEEDEDEDVDNVKKKTIPDAVFGSALAEKVHEEQEEEEQKLGAKERFKRMKQM